RATSRSVALIPTVDICAHTAPSGNASPSVAASTASPSESSVTTTSAPSTASWAEPATVTPCSASGSARSRVRLWARTSRPAPARLRATGAPMMPVPRTAIHMALVTQNGADPAERAEVLVEADPDHLGGLLDRLLDRLLDDVGDRRGRRGRRAVGHVL